MRPTSATGTSGFTLVEVLVVVAIAGILVAVAAVNLFPSEEQLARREAANVALEIERARDQAWFGGRPTAVTMADGRMQAWRHTPAGWQPDPARVQALPPTLRVTGLSIDGETLAPGERLVFLPDGLGIPFRLAMEVRGMAWAVEGDAVGAVRLAR